MPNSRSVRLGDPLLADASLSPADRNFRLNWVANRKRSPRGEPLLCPEFVVHQGRQVRLVDIRGANELLGPTGYVPGADWLPPAIAKARLLELDRMGPLVLVSRDGDDAAALAKELELEGFTMVGAMEDGMLGWRHFGFAISRSADILSREGQMRTIEPDPDDGSRLTLLEIEEHVGNPFEVKWVRMAGLLLQGRHHCVDGRDDSGIVGTPGGDAGEFCTILSCVEKELGRPLTSAEVGGLFHHVLDAFGAFYMHSDVVTTETLVRAMRADPRLASEHARLEDGEQLRSLLSRPPRELRPVLLEHLLVPGHQGCGHLKLMWSNPERYGVRPDLVRDVVRCFFEARWEGADECEFVVLAGDHDEKAVLAVLLDTEIFPFTQIPLVSPMCHNSQMFVSHPQVASYYRWQLAEFICRQPDVVRLDPAAAPRIRAASDALAENQTMATLGKLAPGLPIFEVTFHTGGQVGVRYAGDVPSP